METPENKAKSRVLGKIPQQKRAVIANTNMRETSICILVHLLEKDPQMNGVNQAQFDAQCEAAGLGVAIEGLEDLKGAGLIRNTVSASMVAGRPGTLQERNWVLTATGHVVAQKAREFLMERAAKEAADLAEVAKNVEGASDLIDPPSRRRGKKAESGVEGA
jgi:hypothetical protein